MTHSDSEIGQYCNAAFHLLSAAQPRPKCNSGWWTHSQRTDESVSFSCGEECVIFGMIESKSRCESTWTCDLPGSSLHETHDMICDQGRIANKSVTAMRLQSHAVANFLASSGSHCTEMSSQYFEKISRLTFALDSLQNDLSHASGSADSNQILFRNYLCQPDLFPCDTRPNSSLCTQARQVKDWFLVGKLKIWH